MADKRDQFSISLRYDGEHPQGVWVITQAEWRTFRPSVDQDGGYWSHMTGKEVFHREAREDDGDAWAPPDVRAEYERLIGYDPEYDPGSAINLVEMISDEDEAFDQPCKFGHRVDGHAVYCHNSKWLYSPTKCHRTWYTGGEVRDEDCEGFAPNPHFAHRQT